MVEGTESLRKTLFCEDCYCSRLFNKTLSYLKGKVPRIGEKLMIAIIGDFQSEKFAENEENMTEGEIIRKYMAKDFFNVNRVLTKARAPNKILNEIHILYVDTGNKRNKVIVENWSEQYKIPMTSVKIESAFEDDKKKLVDFLKMFKDQDEVLKIVT